MTSDGQSIERLREYLQGLKPEARAMLITELERGLLRGEEVAGSDLVLQELRRTIRAAAQPAPRIGDAARMFFLPLEPFLADGPGEHRRAGRMPRASLEPVWEWIRRDLMAAESRALTQDVNRALLANDRVKADQLMRALHDRAIQRIGEALAAIGHDEKARRRLGVQVGTPRSIDDLRTLVAVLSIRDVLADLGRRLPGHIRAFEREYIDHARSLLDAATTQKSLDSVAARKPDVFLYGLTVVMNRLAAPWQLIRIATRAAESDNTARIAETPYAVAVALVLGELESMVGELRAELKAGRPIASMLKGIHDAARELRSEMDLSVDSAWTRQLAMISSDVSNLLKGEIETTPGRIRRLLRLRAAKEIAPGSLLDAIDVKDAETRVEFVSACRHYGAELAVSEMTLRTYSELKQYLESATRILLEALRHATDAERPFRQSQIDAAVRLCRTIFGSDYARHLAKAAEVAIQAAAMERKRA